MFLRKAIFPVSVLAFALGLPRDAQAARPISREALSSALQRGGMSSAELAAIVKSAGAGFTLTPADEKTLISQGASAELLEAVRASRVSARVRSDGRPLAPIELILKLFHGSPATATAALKTRGAGFDLNPPLEAQILEAGGDKSLLALVALRRLDFEPSGKPAPEPAEAEPTAAPVRSGDAPAERGPKPIRVDAATQLRKLLRKGEIEYPQMALRARIPGRVVVEALIGRDGRVRRARVLRGDDMFHDAAMQAVLQNAYRPTLLDEEAVEVLTEVNVEFDPARADTRN